MSAFLLTDDREHVVSVQCTAHPDYEGTRQSIAYLEGCRGCRAVYAAKKAAGERPGMAAYYLRLRIIEVPS